MLFVVVVVAALSFPLEATKADFQQCLVHTMMTASTYVRTSDHSRGKRRKLDNTNGVVFLLIFLLLPAVGRFNLVSVVSKSFPPG